MLKVFKTNLEPDFSLHKTRVGEYSIIASILLSVQVETVQVDARASILQQRVGPRNPSLIQSDDHKLNETMDNGSGGQSGEGRVGNMTSVIGEEQSDEPLANQTSGTVPAETPANGTSSGGKQSDEPMANMTTTTASSGGGMQSDQALANVTSSTVQPKTLANGTSTSSSGKQSDEPMANMTSGGSGKGQSKTLANATTSSGKQSDEPSANVTTTSGGRGQSAVPANVTTSSGGMQSDGTWANVTSGMVTSNLTFVGDASANRQRRAARWKTWNFRCTKHLCV